MPTYDDRFLLEILRRRMLGQGATEIAQELGISREKVYPALEKAFERQMLLPVTPPDIQLEAALAAAFDVPADRHVHVVNAVAPSSREDVATMAAHHARELIHEVATAKAEHGLPRVVHVGLGGGNTMMRTSDELEAVLSGDTELPKLVFHAITSGFDIFKPERAPVSFLRPLKKRLPTEVELVGLSAPAAVSDAEYAKVKRNHGVAEAFEAARDVDVVLTSIASAQDEHGTLRTFGRVRPAFRVKTLERCGWKGDLLYGPFGERGPILEKAGLQAVTLFTLRDLRELVRQPRKHVLVIASPCWECGTPKTSALLPLLLCPELAVWTHLVTDVTTARELLEAAARMPLKVEPAKPANRSEAR